MVTLLGALLAATGTAQTDAGDPEASALPSPQQLEAEGAVIGNVYFDRQNVFDLSDPEEDKWLYRLANRWHIVTRESVIRDQLLFRPGDRYEKRVLEESERILRQNQFFWDAKIEVVAYQDGVADIRVWTRDQWTLMPGFSVSRSGGENRVRLSVSERNLLGHGVSVRLNYTEDVDRESYSVQYYDRNLGSSWTSLFLELADSSDGDTTDVRVIRPFYKLDARWSAGGTIFDERRQERFFNQGEEAAEYAIDQELHTAFIGWSKGLQDGWVKRWTAGFVYDDRQFSQAIDSTLPSLLPEDRTLVYPFIGYQQLEDRFEATSNRDQIDRTEDFYLGTQVQARLGYATETMGSDRDSVLYSLSATRGFGSMSKKALLLSGSMSGRFDEGDAVNQVLALDARYYNKLSDKILFFMTLSGEAGSDRDLDNLVDLGGDTGLRGYPLRYQTGESKVLFTAEQRYFFDWYPFKLFRVGGAAFADIGRVWGDNPTGDELRGWLKDVGVGLRLAPTRASGRDVIHIDLAFPLDGDPTIDNVQFLIESKRSF
jgi:outer membrane protein assembly factor BamA